MSLTARAVQRTMPVTLKLPVQRIMFVTFMLLDPPTSLSGAHARVQRS